MYTQELTDKLTKAIAKAINQTLHENCEMKNLTNGKRDAINNACTIINKAGYDKLHMEVWKEMVKGFTI